MELKVSILVVDDSVLMRNKLVKMLTDLDFNVVGEAKDGQDAISKFKKYLPDIVTMDISMPVMNGIYATEQIINSYPNANIIMLSALNQKDMVLQALEKGAKHFIVKPFTSDKLKTVIEQVLWEM
jgi:two-component system chemotaxis response regulator CheY